MPAGGRVVGQHGHHEIEIDLDHGGRKPVEVEEAQLCGDGLFDEPAAGVGQGRVEVIGDQQGGPAGPVQDGDLADRAVVVAQCGDGFDDFQQAGALVQRDAHFLALLGRGLLGGTDQVVAAAADGHEADAGRVQTLRQA